MWPLVGTHSFESVGIIIVVSDHHQLSVVVVDRNHNQLSVVVFVSETYKRCLVVLSPTKKYLVVNINVFLYSSIEEHILNHIMLYDVLGIELKILSDRFHIFLRKMQYIAL